MKANVLPTIWECGPLQKAHFAAQDMQAAGQWCTGGTNWLLLPKFRLSAKSLWNNLWGDAVCVHMRIGIVLPLLSLWTWFSCSPTFASAFQASPAASPQDRNASQQARETLAAGRASKHPCRGIQMEVHELIETHRLSIERGDLKLAKDIWLLID